MLIENASGHFPYSSQYSLCHFQFFVSSIVKRRYTVYVANVVKTPLGILVMKSTFVDVTVILEYIFLT